MRRYFSLLALLGGRLQAASPVRGDESPNAPLVTRRASVVLKVLNDSQVLRHPYSFRKSASHGFNRIDMRCRLVHPKCHRPKTGGLIRE